MAEFVSEGHSTGVGHFFGGHCNGFPSIQGSTPTVSTDCARCCDLHGEVLNSQALLDINVPSQRGKLSNGTMTVSVPGEKV